MNIDSLADLETRGFLHVRGFLGLDEIQLVRDDHARLALDENGNFNSKTPTAAVMARLTPRFDEVLRQVNAQTSLRVDVYVPDTSLYFAVGTNDGVNFPWHQDHESFYMVQNHFDYLNFYMPVIKPDPAKSNVSLIPFDALRSEAPRAYEFLVRNGAGHFHPVAGRWIATNDDRGGMRVIKPDLEQLAFTPQLEVGDLLLLRGDIIHRTQDADTDRVALSWRAANGATTISRSRLAAGGLRKAEMMRRHTGPYQRMFDAFDTAQKDEMSLTELLDVYASSPVRAPVDARAFSRQLFAEKRRAHAVGGYIASVPKTYGLKAMHLAQRNKHRLGAARRHLVPAKREGN